MDRLSNKSAERVVTGLMAQVTILPDRVILRPTESWNKPALLEKMKQERLFRALAPNVPGLYHPKILNEDEPGGRFEIERAKGINLSSGSYDSAGKLTDFLKIPIETKLRGMLTYLETIAKINEQGYSFVDHKTDSVFLDPETGSISIVDSSGLKQEQNPRLVWVRENSAVPISDVLKAFFTKGYSDHQQNEEGLIPRTLLPIIENSKQEVSANKVLEKIRKWINSETKKQSPEELKSILTLLARGFKVERWLEQKLETVNLESVSEYEYALLETELYTEAILKSERPQALDRTRPS